MGIACSTDVQGQVGESRLQLHLPLRGAKSDRASV
jgi:hypothetical protein